MIKHLKFILMTLSASLSYIVLPAQEQAFTLEAKRNDDQSVDFNYRKTDPGTYTVVVNFSTLTNASRPGNSFTARDYNDKLFSLNPTAKDQGISYNYSISYIRGKLSPKYDPNFVYLLPYKNETKVQIAEVGFLGAAYFGDTAPEDWKAYRFYTENQDTVTAIRKGIVVDIKDLYETSDDNKVTYTSKTNELIMEHPDGTLATYRGFKKGSFAVKVGETVFPGTPLALNSKYDTNGKYNISIMISYLKSIDFGNRPATLSKSKSFYGFVNPHFLTKDQKPEILVPQKTYSVASSLDAIQKEMTKKELKLRSSPKY